MKKIGLKVKLTISVLLFAAIAWAFMFGSNIADDRYADEKLTAVRDAVRRAAVSCYAIEGVYPPDIDYMKQNYGLAVDEDKYTLIYIIYASNMMPDIDVLPLKQRNNENMVTQMSVQ